MSTASSRALAEEVQRRRAALRAKLRLRQPEQRRRRWWLVALILAVLLALLLSRCQCTPPPVEEAAEGATLQEPGTPQPTEAGPPPLPPVAPLNRRDRPAFEGPGVARHPWLDAFRMQVTVRSPRLAACFNGMAEPGALRWTSSLDPVRGLVSEQSLEPTLSGAVLTAKQENCIMQVLSAPPYALQVEGGRATPSRVSMVIEF